MGRLRGRPQLRAPLEPGDRDLHRDPDRPQPLLRRPGDDRQTASWRSSAATSRPTRASKDTNLYNPQKGTWTRGADMSVARWYPTATALPDGRVFVISGDGITLNEPGMSVPLTDALQHAAVDLRPEDRHLDRHAAGLAADPALPVHVRPAERQALRRRPGHHHAHVRPATRTSGRRSARARSTARARSCTGPGKILKSGTWSDPEFPGRAVTNRAAAIDMTAALAGLARGRADEVPALVPHAHGAARRQGARHRRPDRHRRRGRDDRRPRHRDLGSGHRHVDAHRLPPAPAPLPLVRAAPARRPRAARRRRRVRQREEREERRDLLAALPVQGPAADDHRRPATAQLRPAVHGRHAGRRPDPLRVAGPHGLGHAQPRHGPALHEPDDERRRGQRAARRSRRTPTWRRPASTWSS